MTGGGPLLRGTVDLGQRKLLSDVAIICGKAEKMLLKCPASLACWHAVFPSFSFMMLEMGGLSVGIVLL